MKKNLILTALILGVCGVVAVYIAANAYKYKYKSTQTISVTGNALKDFDADIVKWRATFSRSGFDLSSASEMLKEDRNKVNDFLLAQGIKADNITFESVSIRKTFSYEYDSNGNSRQVFTGYTLSQDVTVESLDLDVVDKASREISSLITSGVELNSERPNYYYSKLEDLKLELISNASANARQRAENIADEADTKLGELVKADLGVFQITGRNDNDDYSYGGAFNTKSREKTANVTVRLNFRTK